MRVNSWWVLSVGHILSVFLLAVALSSSTPCDAQEKPYFVLYSQDMEEPGNLEIESMNVVGGPEPGNSFIGSNLELEYGVRAWWTSELYLDGQSTRGDSTIFTGFRWENRFRPLMREHWINPVLYVEYENTSADKTLREIVGHDGKDDFLESNASARAGVEREMEVKLILGSNVHGWNVSENFIAEKNLSNAPWEFGYAVGASRALKMAASAQPCTFCREKFQAGVELYGGLGDWRRFGMHLTSPYLGPSINWEAPGGMTLSFGPHFGLNNYSIPVLYRFGVSYEIQQLFSHLRLH
ncbi:MAG TPA: hypothetical protein VKW78_15355 [Terriglobales bacterium]|nr:hypothetical protein [Terriglobales bacterium]